MLWSKAWRVGLSINTQSLGNSTDDMFIVKRFSHLLVNIIFLVLLSSLTTIQASPGEKINSQKVEFTLEKIVDGLGIPWGLAFISGSEMLINQREGRVALLNIKTRQLTNILGVPKVFAKGQGGLLDVAVPPDYTTGSWIYFTFSRDILSEGVTVLARAKLKDNKLVDWQDLLETESATGTGYHFGSRIAFDNSTGETGYIYFSIGDRGIRSNGQDLTNHASTIIRLHRDGRVPIDNPFVKHEDVLPEIWSYGHRNPQGMAYDYKKKRLWSIEHGPRGGDEINLIVPGLNYGWPVISYGKEYWGPFDVGEGTSREGMEQPIKQYTPAIAPGSLLLYSGKAFPQWQGNLFSGALKLTHLNRVTLDKGGEAVSEERLLEDKNMRIRALVQGHEGRIYFSTDHGEIFVMRPVS